MIVETAQPPRAVTAGGVRVARRPDFWWFVAYADGCAFAAAFVVTGLWGPLSFAHTAIAFAALAGSGLQQPKLDPRVAPHLPRVVAALAVPVLFLAPIAAMSGQGTYLTRWVPISSLLVLAARTTSGIVIRRARRRREIGDRTVIVGCGGSGEQLAERSAEHPEYGLRPIGFVDHFAPERTGLPLLGTPSDLEGLLDQDGVQRVVVAFGAVGESDLVAVLRACDRFPVEVHVMPRLFELGVTSGPDHDEVWGVQLVRLRRAFFRPTYRAVKRAMDLVLAGTAVVLLAPVFAAIAIAVRLTSPGPILFRQERIGSGGQPITVLKFRTLRVNDDSDNTWNVGDDDRKTRVGSILRSSSLDELPQLFNVIRGDMSLVGPRPEREGFAHHFLVSIPRYGDRHRVPAGITGRAQVHGLRGDTSIAERAEFDNRYVEGWSPWQDMVILWRTVGALLRREGA